MNCSEEVLLRLDRISKAFAGHRVLREVCLGLRPGEVHVLAGENGAGKSTLIKILAGIHTQYEGQIILGGQPVRFSSPVAAARAGISVIHQELSLIDSMSVAENLFLLEPRVDLKRARELCAQVGLEIDVTRAVEEFPISVKNCIEIAKALKGGPAHSKVIVMDEPTSALNQPEAERLFTLIGRLKGQGCGIIYISHKMEEIARLADRVTVLRDGA